MKITLFGRVLSKKNSKGAMCRNGIAMVFVSAKYRQWEKEKAIELLQFKIGKPMEYVSIVMSFFLPDKRKTDLINKAEGLLDLLVDNGFITDDDWTHVNSLHLLSGGIDRENPRVEIEIIELEQ